MNWPKKGSNNWRKKMKTIKWRRYTFADGYIVECKGMSKRELMREESIHGLCISIEPIVIRI